MRFRLLFASSGGARTNNRIVVMGNHDCDDDYGVDDEYIKVQMIRRTKATIIIILVVKIK